MSARAQRYTRAPWLGWRRAQFAALFYFWRLVYRISDWLLRYTKPCPCTTCAHKRRVYSRGLS